MPKQSLFPFFWAALSGQECDVSVLGYDLCLRPRTPDLKVAAESLGREFDVPLSYFKEDFDGVIIDAGGYIGTAAMKFANQFPHAKVVTIEPSSENFQLLEKNTSKISNISQLNAALSTSDEKKVTLRDRGTGEWGFTVVENPSDVRATQTLSECDVVNLNDLINELGGEIGLLKMDIEGAEYDMLADAAKTWLPKVKLLVIELHERIVPGVEERFANQCAGRANFCLDGEKLMSLRV